MVIQAGFFISFLTGVAVSLGYRINAGILSLEGSRTIRMILPTKYLIDLFGVSESRRLDFLVAYDITYSFQL